MTMKVNCWKLQFLNYFFVDSFFFRHDQLPNIRNTINYSYYDNYYSIGDQAETKLLIIDYKKLHASRWISGQFDQEIIIRSKRKKKAGYAKLCL